MTQMERMCGVPMRRSLKRPVKSRGKAAVTDAKLQRSVFSPCQKYAEHPRGKMGATGAVAGLHRTLGRCGYRVQTTRSVALLALPSIDSSATTNCCQNKHVPTKAILPRAQLRRCCTRGCTSGRASLSITRPTRKWYSVCVCLLIGPPIRFLPNRAVAGGLDGQPCARTRFHSRVNGLPCPTTSQCTNST